MIALTLIRYNVDAGILIVHKTTHAPLLIGDTPASKLLLDTYVNGERFVALDKTRKCRERRIPPLDFDKFMTLGVEYFALASFALSQQPCTHTDSIDIEGTSYKLRNINGAKQ